MEALVGDMYDGDEGVVTSDIQQLDENTWLIKGSADIDEVCEQLGIELEDDEFDTFNGFVCSIIQRIPDDSETFTCETKDLIINVRSVKNRIVQSASVSKKQKETE